MSQNPVKRTNNTTNDSIHYKVELRKTIKQERSLYDIASLALDDY